MNDGPPDRKHDSDLAHALLARRHRGIGQGTDANRQQRQLTRVAPTAVHGDGRTSRCAHSRPPPAPAHDLEFQQALEFCCCLPGVAPSRPGRETTICPRSHDNPRARGASTFPLSEHHTGYRFETSGRMSLGGNARGVMGISAVRCQQENGCSARNCCFAARAH